MPGVRRRYCAIAIAPAAPPFQPKEKRMTALRIVGLVLAISTLTTVAGAVLADGTTMPPPVDGPVITDFETIWVNGTTWKLCGTVKDFDGSTNILIVFGNMNSLDGVTTWVNPDGSFCQLVTFQPGEFGMATAYAIDDRGKWSQTVEDLIFSNR
jgi:hypothetical protein